MPRLRHEATAESLTHFCRFHRKGGLACVRHRRYVHQDIKEHKRTRCRSSLCGLSPHAILYFWVRGSGKRAVHRSRAAVDGWPIWNLVRVDKRRFLLLSGDLEAASSMSGAHQPATIAVAQTLIRTASSTAVCRKKVPQLGSQNPVPGPSTQSGRLTWTGSLFNDGSLSLRPAIVHWTAPPSPRRKRSLSLSAQPNSNQQALEAPRSARDVPVLWKGEGEPPIQLGLWGSHWRALVRSVQLSPHQEYTFRNSSFTGGSDLRLGALLRDLEAAVSLACGAGGAWDIAREEAEGSTPRQQAQRWRWDTRILFMGFMWSTL